MPAWPGSHYTGMHIREITSSIQKSRDCHEQSLLIERFIAALRWCALLGNCQAATLSGIAGQHAYTIPTILRARKARPCFENAGHKCKSHALRVIPIWLKKLVKSPGCPGISPRYPC